MSLGLVGRKVGMMRIFKDDGTSVPVTVLDCSGNRVAQVCGPGRPPTRACPTSPVRAG